MPGPTLISVFPHGERQVSHLIAPPIPENSARVWKQNGEITGKSVVFTWKSFSHGVFSTLRTRLDFFIFIFVSLLDTPGFARQFVAVMKKLTYVLILFALASVVPVQAARTGRPTVAPILVPPTPISPI
ncbi:MAG: hypothetical protein NTV46_21795 [Verrucomicrobia bacterium]|nr:hypothetical protein [Verrucomicrobiota bacterium]